MEWLAGVYVNAMNVIHYMHDKYAYERIEMALHDYAPLRTMAFGMAGLSVVADSLSAIKHAQGEGDPRRDRARDRLRRPRASFPMFGNNDNRVDQIATLGGQHLHDQAPEAPDLPERGPHPVDPHHHLERGVREGDGQHAGRPARRASRSRRAPTRCTAGTATASMPRRPRWPRSPTATRPTASRSPRRWCRPGSGGSRRTGSPTSPASSTPTSAPPATT